MKKFLTFVLVLAMVLSVSSVALAADTLPTADTTGLIKLTEAVSLDSTFAFDKGGTFTLDLAGFNITSSVDPAFKVKKGTTLKVINSGATAATITADRDAFYLGEKGNSTEFGNLEIGANVNVVSKTGNCVYLVSGSKLVSEGNLTSNSTIYAAIQGNGSYGNTEIEIKGGSVEGKMGIYHPQAGVLNVKGGTIKGETGIEMRAGILNVTGGKIEATGSFSVPAGGNSNGSTVNGAAVAVSQHTTNLPINVTIKGGTLTGPKALYVTDLEDDPSGTEEAVTLNVTNGTFEGPVEVDDTGANSNGGANLSAKKFISGGTFSADPSAYLESDAVAASINEGGTDSYAVGKESIQKKVKDMVDSGKNPEGITVTVTNGTVNFNTGDLPGKVKITDNDSTGSVTVNNQPVSSAPVVMPTPVPEKPASTGSGISVKYNGGNSFSTSNPAVPTGVEIDGVPVTFNGNGSNFSVGCISSDAKWVTVRWNSTTVTTNFTPDGLVECTTVAIPKTGDMPIWAAVAAFFGF